MVGVYKILLIVEFNYSFSSMIGTPKAIMERYGCWERFDIEQKLEAGIFKEAFGYMKVCWRTNGGLKVVAYYDFEFSNVIIIYCTPPQQYDDYWQG